MSASAERKQRAKPRAKYGERVEAGYVYVAAWFKKGEVEVLDRLALKKGTRKAGRSTVLRELVKRGLKMEGGSEDSYR
ncbi:MAG TPA: hypothetical protein VKK79_22720, partial [Candidatus Lokiarchaeia archaeon]|nr:hypothetical protein [Candidatus Lokiarchaeia archaeon]